MTMSRASLIQIDPNRHEPVSEVGAYAVLGDGVVIIVVLSLLSLRQAYVCSVATPC